MKRLFIVLPVALLMTFFVFGSMTWLVNLGKTQIPEQSPSVHFDIVQLEQQSPLLRRQRLLPEPPPKQVQAPTTKITTTSHFPQPALSLENLDLPKVAIDRSVTGLAITSPSAINIGQNQQLMPLHRMEPRYPTMALRRKIEGYVVLSFTINKAGTPVNIKVLQSKPRRIFDKEASRALKNWRYQPLMVDGEPQPLQGQTIKLEFKLQ
ncbi:energy transducer TonB [Vibrio gallicus]|uniref:energy transducer TonB n=1 Tax=Vibrio gallicus TaxID=190897 RepID=UPI0021C322D2|nr:energy transducer TonB [Vibrio gallicus]